MRHSLMPTVIGTILLVLAPLVARSQELAAVSGAAVRCETVGSLPADETDRCSGAYYRCELRPTDSVPVPVAAQCPDGRVYSRDARQCVDAATVGCGGISLAGPRDVGFQCTSSGRFPDLDAPDCKAYFLCTKNTDGSLIPARVTCPGTTIFSPEKMSCVSSPPNVCPQATTMAPSPSTAVTPGPFVCPDEGRYANEQSPDCQTYYLCLYSGSSLVAQLTQCASSMVFFPAEGRCVSSDQYSCPNLVTASPTVPTTTSTASQTTREPSTNIPLTTP
uniref:Chitin-binding type-2 domain-containing protein n=1 Tax=Anopheles melas TaxID=34690 RepID=A0A182UDY5_9DIPT